MNLITQPPSSHMCGHAVVAMLAGTTPERVADVLAHDRPTTWTELYSVLFMFGVVCAPKLVPCFGPDDMADVAVVALPSCTPAYGHWVLKIGGLVYDPARDEPYSVEALPFELTPSSKVITFATVRNRSATVCTSTSQGR